MRKNSKRRGMFVVESIVAAAAIAIMGSVGFPVIGSARSKANQTTCVSNQRQIVALAQMFAQDHGELLPKAASIWADIMVDPDVLKCREDQKNANSYVYNNRLSGLSIGWIADPTATIMTADGETVKGKNRTLDNTYYSPVDVQYRHSRKAVVGYTDGHVDSILKVTEPESWDKPGKK